MQWYIIKELIPCITELGDKQYLERRSVPCTREYTPELVYALVSVQKAHFTKCTNQF